MSEPMKTKRVWIAWGNTDITEGRGQMFPFVISESRACCIRNGKRAYVMGSDCPVEPFECPYVDGRWLAPARFERPSKEDEQADKRQQELEAAIEKARAAGLDEATIKTLTL